MKKWNGRESDYEKAERKESEMGIYEERLQCGGLQEGFLQIKATDFTSMS